MKYDVGYYVIIKSWSRMVKEYSVTSDTIIMPTYNFVKSMDHLCGKVLKIESISMFRYECSLNGKRLEWYITDEMILKKFDIYKDLIKGDKIRRVKHVTGAFKLGKVYTFRTYNPPSDLVTEEVTNSGFINSFEFVSRDYEEKTKEEEVDKNCIACKARNKEEIAFIIKALLGLGYARAYSIHVEEAWKSVFIIADRKNKTIDYIQEIDYPHVSLETFIKEVQAPVKTEYYYAEFIQAMKETAIEYINGKHTFHRDKCKLCQVLISKGYKINRYSGCEICPHTIITGTTCKTKEPYDIKRAIELLQWIEIYEEKLKEDVNS